MHPSPWLAQYVGRLEKRPALNPITLMPGRPRLDKTVVDVSSNLVVHSSHQLIPLASARHRRCRIR
jgi:hypothetical protein